MIYMMNKKGFTLIELLITIIIIGTLSGVILTVINPSGIRARSRDAQRVGDLKKIQTALELYFADNRGYPANAASWLRITPTTSITPGVPYSAFPGTYVVLPSDPRNAEANTNSCGGVNTYGYFYRTVMCAGSPCVTSKYVIRTYMETSTAAAESLCSSLTNCSGGAGVGVANCDCATPCYGVQNPL
jgi:prepilin-type N-terminal cleavage/methylation domain-containing protein